MSERERWIVYPLLLLGLGASLKDKLVAPSVVKAEMIECNQIQCRQQLVTNQLTADQVTVAKSLSAGQVVVTDQKKRPRILLRTIPARQGDTVLKEKTRGQISLFDETNRVMCALGLPIVCSQLVCAGPIEILGSRLRVYDRAGKLKAQIRSSEVGKLRENDANDQQPAVTTGRFELYGSDPASIVTMGSLEQGGFVAVTHEKRRQHVMLNHNRLGSGLFAVDANGNAKPLAVVPPTGEGENADVGELLLDE
jgi:hypothetical protein